MYVVELLMAESYTMYESEVYMNQRALEDQTIHEYTVKNGGSECLLLRFLVPPHLY